MREIFADTFFYVAAVNPRDESHASAREWLTGVRVPLLTTEYVLVEVGNWLAGSGDMAVFVELMKSIEADAATRVVPGDSQLFRAGVALCSKRLDKDWSLTDCTSFVVMEREGITEALTADRHFEQAGFKALLR